MSGDELDFAVRTAAEAGEILLGKRHGELVVSTKVSESDPVSDADRASEEHIVAAIRRCYPDDGVLGEEGTHVVGVSGRRWVIDPLDGTVNYLYGRDAFAVSIALEDADGVAVGVVHAPVRGDSYAARRGDGASRGEAPMGIARAASLAGCLLATGFSYESEKRVRQSQALASELGVMRDVRREGSAALDLASVASGTCDLYYEEYIRPWDVAAGSALVTEAGGAVVTWDSAPGYLGVAAGDAVRVRELLDLLGR